MYGRDHQGRTLRHVYAASPTTGVLCVWVLDTATADNSESGGVECNASVRLKLKEGEVLTALTPMSESGGDAWLLVSTSLGRLWKIYKTSRPLTLHAKLVKRRMIAENTNGLDEEEGEETGIVRGLYNYFTTPSKKTNLNDEDMAAMDEGDHNNDTLEEEDIVALVPIPSMQEAEVSLDVAGKSPGRSPVRGPAGRSPPPRKQQKISSVQTSSFSSSSSARVISLSSSLVVKEWKVSLFAGSQSNSDETAISSNSINAKKEGCISHTQLFPRHNDGTLDLSRLLASVKSNDTIQDSLEGYSDIDILGSPSLAKDGKSLLVVLRIENGNAESTRVYMVRIGLDSTPYIVDAAWLDRYSGQSLTQAGGSLECVGLVVADEDVEDETSVGNVVGCVAYVGFGPRGISGSGVSGGGQPSVTISAVHFSSVDTSADSGHSPPRVKDLDLYSNIVPCAIQNSMSYDPLTGGCVLLATSGLLCGAHVRFPPSPSLGANNNMREEQGITGSSSLDTFSLSQLAQDENVLTIKSHLQSAFRQYLHQLKEKSGNTRAVVPPSVGTCSSHVLAAAVVLASKDFVTCSKSSGGITSPFSPPRAGGSSSSPVTVLRDKLQLHTDFVTFLLHAGAYRRVSTAGRILLRDHGEMITAARSLLIECQGYFSKAEASAAGDDNRQGELTQLRQLVTSALEGTSNNVLALPLSWAGLQQHLPNDSSLPLGRDLLLLTSSSICQGIGAALRYRQNESSPLYDIPNYDASSLSSPSSSSYHNSPSPWTSSAEMLEVLFSQLRSIQQFGESILSYSLDYEMDKANLRRYVEDISASALSGHCDVVLHSDPNNNDDALKSYEDAKLLAVPLLRQYANSENDDDLIALQTSLAHSFFEGIVQICHDHRQSWRFQGPYSNEDADERYDLRTMIANTSSDSPYAHLHRSRDYRTGLSFCGYVLRWYADRGLHPEVFELGKNCPHDLTRYVRNDDRLSNLAWLQHLRVGGHEQATVGLLSLTTPILFGGDKQVGGGTADKMGLWEKDQMMSLAKLSNKLASAKSTNPTAVDGNHRNTLIENSLTLISAQRILQEDTELGDEIALKEDDLLRLAVEKIQSSRDVDEIKRYGICGLAIASAKAPGQKEAMANAASSIWHAVIKADIHTWQSVANENGMAVGGGISEEELIQRVEGTAFVGVMYDFVTTSGGNIMQNVGFHSELVQNQVLHALLGSEDLAKVLTLSAEIVVDAN